MFKFLEELFKAPPPKPQTRFVNAENERIAAKAFDERYARLEAAKIQAAEKVPALLEKYRKKLEDDIAKFDFTCESNGDFIKLNRSNSDTSFLKKAILEIKIEYGTDVSETNGYLEVHENGTFYFENRYPYSYGGFHTKNSITLRDYPSSYNPGAIIIKPFNHKISVPFGLELKAYNSIMDCLK